MLFLTYLFIFVVKIMIEIAPFCLFEIVSDILVNIQQKVMLLCDLYV